MLLSLAAPLGGQGSGSPAASQGGRAAAPQAASPFARAGSSRPPGREAAAPAPQRVTLDLRDVPLRDALKAVATQSGVSLVYDSHSVPLDRRVSFRVAVVPAVEALRAALRGTDVDVRTASGSVVLVRPVGRAVRPPAAGVIAGRVTDAETGAPLPGATVLLGGTRLRATAGDDGQYRIGDVAPGTYTLIARRLGYAPVSQPFTVEREEASVVNFALTATAGVLAQVVVTGTIVPTEIKAVPVPVSVITASDLERQRPQTIGDAIRQVVPSVVAWDFGVNPSQTAMSARGASSLDFGGGTMKVYLDGIEITDRTFAAVDPRSIERVEVIRGPQAATIYGSDAIGGVMQITTKRGVPGPARPQLDVQAAAGVVQGPYGDVGGGKAARQEYAASLQGGTPAATYHVGGSYTRTGDWLPESGTSLPSLHGGVRLVQGRLTLDLSGRNYVQNTGAPFDPRLARTGFVSFSKPNHRAITSKEQTLGARLGYTPVPWWRHDLTVGVDRLSSESHTTSPVRTTPSDTLLSVSEQQLSKEYVTYNTSVSGALTPSLSGSVIAGVEHFSRNSDGYFTSGATRTTGAISLAPGRTISASRNTIDNTGYFAQGQLGVRDIVFLTAGLRVERNSTFGRDLGAPLSPRVGLSYAPTIGAATVKLRASYGEAIKPPGPGQRDALVSGFSRQIENAKLGPERQGGWDAGADVGFGSRGFLGATYYVQTGRDLIQLVFVDATTTPLTQQYQNVGRVKNDGLELEGALHFSPARLTAQYAATRSRLRALAPGYTGDLRVGDQLLLVPSRTGGVSLALTPLRATTMTMGLTYVGEWTYYDIFAQLSCFGGTGPCRPALRAYHRAYPAFTKVNFGVTQQITPAASAFLSVKNLMNNDAYEFSDAVPVTGRVTMVGLRLRY